MSGGGRTKSHINQFRLDGIKTVFSFNQCQRPFDRKGNKGPNEPRLFHKAAVGLATQVQCGHSVQTVRVWVICEFGPQPAQDKVGHGKSVGSRGGKVTVGGVAVIVVGVDGVVGYATHAQWGHSVHTERVWVMYEWGPHPGHE